MKTIKNFTISIFMILSIIIGGESFAGPGPNLIAPLNGSVGVTVTPTLDWSDVSSAMKYGLQVSTDSGFSNIVYSNNNINGSAISFGLGFFNHYTAYFWRVNFTDSILVVSDWSTVFKFTTIVAAPTLTSPVNNATGQLTELTLDWNNVAGANTYSLQVSTNSAFSSTIINATGLTSSDYIIESGLLNTNTKYYWRSRSVSSTGTSAYSSVFSFTTYTLPVITVTIPDSIIISSDWQVFSSIIENDSTGTTYTNLTVPYEFSTVSPLLQGDILVEYYDGTDWINLDFTEQNGKLTGIFAAPTGFPLMAGQVFEVSLRIKAGENAPTGDYSVSSSVLDITQDPNELIASYNKSFTVLTALPLVPELVSPSNGSTGHPLSLMLDWNEVLDAGSYDLQVSSDTTFTVLLMDETNIALTEMMVPQGILSNGMWYHWRVRAVNQTGAGSYSNGSSFKTISSAPIVPLLLTPKHGSTGVTVVTPFDWEDVAGTDTYKIQIAADSTFILIVLEETELSSSEYLNDQNPLTENTTYYWRVNAKNKGGEGEYSSVNRFSTEVNQPPAPLLLTPKNGAKQVDLLPTLDWNDAPVESLEPVYELEVAYDDQFVEVAVSKTSITVSEYTHETALQPETQHYWRIRYSTQSGVSEWSEVWSFTTIEVLTGIQNTGGEIPKTFELGQNYPNPFNPTTKIRFGIPQTASGIQNAQVTIYNVLGQSVAQIFNGLLTAGTYEVLFDASSLTSGTYFYELRTDNFRSVKRMALIK
jgi:hypothetical protein